MSEPILRSAESLPNLSNIKKAILHWLDDEKSNQESGIPKNPGSLSHDIMILLDSTDSVAIKTVAALSPDLLRALKSTPLGRNFVLSLLPLLIRAYLRSFFVEGSFSPELEGCLLGIYNNELLLDASTASMSESRLPDLHLSSFYHEPFAADAMRSWCEELAPSLSPLSPGAGAVSQALGGQYSTLGSTAHSLGGAHPHASQAGSGYASGTNGSGPALMRLPVARADGVDPSGACAAILFSVNHQTRFPMLTRLLVSYYLNISALSHSSYLHICRFCIWYCASGMEPSQFLNALLVSASTRALNEQQQQQAPKSNAANTRSTRGSLSVVSPLAAAPASAAAPGYTGAMLNRACLQAAVAASCSHSEAADELQALLLRLRPALERRRLPFDASFFAALVHSVRYATFNGFRGLGRLALQEARQRAEAELDSMALIVVQALDHLLASFPDASFGHELSLEHQLKIAKKSTADWDKAKGALQNGAAEESTSDDEQPVNALDVSVQDLLADNTAFPLAATASQQRISTGSARASADTLGVRFSSDMPNSQRSSQTQPQRASAVNSRSSEPPQLRSSGALHLVPQLLATPQLRSSAAGLSNVDGSSKLRLSSEFESAGVSARLSPVGAAPRSPQLSSRSSIVEARARFFSGMLAADAGSDGCSNRNSSASTPGEQHQSLSELQQQPNASLSAPKPSFGPRLSIDGRILTTATNGSASVDGSQLGARHLAATRKEQVGDATSQQSSGRKTQFELSSLSSQVTQL